MTSEPTAIDPLEVVSPTASKASATGAWSDWVGMVASIGCAIHCAAMPFVIAYLPALGLSFLADEAFHKWMAAICFLIALAAFVPGLRKHRRVTPAIIAGVGLLMISVAAFGFAGECCPSCASGAADDAAPLVAAVNTAVCTDEDCAFCAGNSGSESTDGSDTVSAGLALSLQAPPPWLTPLGGIMLVSAHLLNRRYGCLCGCCRHDVSDEEAG